jgi:predicted enzyme related to lactoylglutathione lyase
MRIVHFEIPADDPARAMAFYGKAFGWTFDKWTARWTTG